MKTWKEAGPGTVAFEVTVPGEPQPAGSKRAFAHKTTGKVVVIDDNKASRAWKEDVRKLARYTRGAEPPEAGALELELVFYLEKPKTVNRELPIVRPDVLKLARAVEDALTGIVYEDDAQIVREFLDKRYAGYAEGPGVVVKVTRL